MIKKRFGNCGCCRVEEVHVKEYDMEYDMSSPIKHGSRAVLLCELCAGTMTSVYALQYPAQHNSDTVEVMRTLCYIGNQILKAVKAVNR